MRRAVLAFCMILGMAGAGVAAAAPGAGGVSAAPDGNFQQASGGCGPYGFRDYYGLCRQRRFYAGPPRFYAGPPRFYGCPPGFRPTPFGCRPYY